MPIGSFIISHQEQTATAIQSMSGVTHKHRDILTCLSSRATITTPRHHQPNPSHWDWCRAERARAGGEIEFEFPSIISTESEDLDTGSSSYPGNKTHG